MVENDPGAAGRRSAHDEELSAETPENEAPILLGREAIRAAWDAARTAE